MNSFPIHVRPGIGRAVRALLFALLLIGLMACDESETATDLELCRDYLDDALWDDAIAICPTDTDEGKSLSGQARMGRAGVSLLDLMDGLSTSSLSGEALIFDLFSLDVGSAEFTDVEDAVNLFLSISDDATTGDSNRTDSDNFNLVIASDVLLMSLLKEHLSMSIDTTTGDFTVPGVTDTGIDTLTSTSTSSEYQTVFDNIYTNNGDTTTTSYYTTEPLNWSDSTRNTDLSRITVIVAANAAGANALGDGGLSGDPDLTSLSALDFASKIDNGTCGTTNATAVLNFPRRLNTSDSTAVYLGDEMQFVNGDTLEWQGGFPLPSALVNPDFFDVDCDDGTAALGEFTTCMETATTAITPNTAGAAQTLVNTLTTTDSTITGAATGTLCNGSDCTMWPLLDIDGSTSTDESTADGTTAMQELKQVLATAWPIDSTVTSPTGTTPSYACSAGDDLVHYREYDAYLRTLGQ